MSDDELTSDEHDAETFRVLLVLADTVRRFLLQNEQTLATLDSIGALSSEYGLAVLTRDSAAANAARISRIAAARAASPAAPETEGGQPG